MRKELWGYMDGSDPAPNNYIKLLQLKVKDARIMCRIIEFANPNIFLEIGRASCRERVCSTV